MDLARTDPAYDDLDEMAEDFAMGIAGIVNSEEAQASYVTVEAPAAGPSYLLGQRQMKLGWPDE